MKRLLIALILVASVAIISLGIYTVDHQNKDFCGEIKSLREQLARLDEFEKKLAAIDDTYKTKVDAVSLGAKAAYTSLENRSPLHIYNTFDCAAHIDTKVLEDNRIQEFSASGTLIRGEDDQLYILTNFHVFDRKAGQFLIAAYARLNKPDSYPEPVELFAWDPVFDLAIVKFKNPQIYTGPVAIFGKSSDLIPGSPVVAIGSGAGLAFSCSEGIIRNTSGAGIYNSPPALQIRTPNVILHSAAFASGNSGGPLITTADGKVVGINYAVMNVGSNGICMNFYLAIPSDDVTRVLPRLFRGGKIDHGWINSLSFNDTFEIPTSSFVGANRPTREGVVISGINPALFEKIQPKLGDLVTAINGVTITSRIELFREIMHSEPSSIAELEILRGNEQLKINLPIIKYEMPH